MKKGKKRRKEDKRERKNRQTIKKEILRKRWNEGKIEERQKERLIEKRRSDERGNGN